MNSSLLIGLLLLCSGCAAIYLASPNQGWLAVPWRHRPARFAGGLVLALGWLVLAGEMQRLTASFVFVTVLMLVFSAFSYLGALLRIRRKGRHV